MADSTGDRLDATGYVLAGGQSRRFGEDKALYSVSGEPLILRPIECLTALFPSVSIIAKTPPVYQPFGVPVVEDVHPQQMPHVGVLSGLEAASTEWCFFLACDMPSMTADVIRRLWRAQQEAEEEGAPVKAVVPETPSGRQPLAAFYARSSLDSLRTAIEKEWSMKAWVESLPRQTVHFDDDAPFENVNRKEDLPAAGDRG